MLPNMVGKCLPDTSAHRTHDHHRRQYPQSELKTFTLTFRCIYNTSKKFYQTIAVGIRENKSCKNELTSYSCFPDEYKKLHMCYSEYGRYVL